jgi:glycosyltransferase involved in cell wall biosynthesis
MKRNILYIHLGLSSFVQKDINILQEEYNLIVHHFKVNDKKKLFLSFIQQILFLVKNRKKSNVIFIQFAGYHSFIPSLLTKFFGEKSILILGGTDCVSFPSIKYGCYYKKILSRFTKFSIRNCTILLPVDQTLIEYDYSYTCSDFPKQGYQFHVSNVKTPYKIIYNGYDSKKWFSSKRKTPNTFVTTGANLSSRFGLELKGIDLLLKVANSFSTCTFYIIGGRSLNVTPPSNVILLDTMDNNLLPAFLEDKQFYLQLSMSEGFPNALCEAMLCECVPIVSNVGSMPMIVSDAGYILKQKNVTLLVNLIKRALSSTDLQVQGQYARRRIQENYTIEKRSTELLAVLKEFI